MLFETLLILLAACRPGKSDFDSDPSGIRIVGGGIASPGQYDFATSLATADGSHFCGGSLIGPRFVLTAAHCMSGSTNFQVRIGRFDITSKSGESIRVKKVFVHPQYDSNSMENDIAIIELQESSKFKPVELDSSSTGEGHTGTTATVVGWGALTEGGRLPAKLHEVKVPVVSKSECNKGYGGAIVDTMICAGFRQGGKDSCQGDSGGPLIIGAPSSRKQVGIVSWGEGCAQRDRYGVYTRVNHFTDYIQNIVSGSGGSGTTPSPPNNDGGGQPTPVSGTGGACSCVGGPGFGEDCGTHGVDTKEWCYVKESNCEGVTVSQQTQQAWAYGPCEGGAVGAPPPSPKPPSGDNDGGKDCKTCDNDGSWGSTCANPDNDPQGNWCFVSNPLCDPFFYCGESNPNNGDSEASPTQPPPNSEEEEGSNNNDLLLYEDWTAKEEEIEKLGWRVVDVGRKQAPSKWTVRHMEQSVKQTENIRTREPHSKHTKLGTRLVYEPESGLPEAWGNDYSFGAQMSSDDNDMLGFFLRYEGDKNFVRVSFDSQQRPEGRSGPAARLVQFVDGVPKLLASADWRYSKSTWYEVETIVAGNLARVLVDGNVLLESDRLVSPKAPKSSVGLYSFANRGSTFSKLRVMKRNAPAPASPSGPSPLEMLMPSYTAKKRIAKSTSRLVLAQAAELNNQEDATESLDDIEDDSEKGGNDDFFSMTNIVIVAACAGSAMLAAVAAIIFVRRSKKSSGKGGENTTGASLAIGTPINVKVNGAPAFSQPSPAIQYGDAHDDAYV